MIIVFTSEGTHYGTWLNFTKLVKDIKNMNKPEWSFAYYKPDKVRTLYEKMKESQAKENLREAYKQNLGVFDICAGEYRGLNPLFVPVTDDLDIEDLKRSWSFDYFKARDLRIFEIQDVGTFEQDITEALGKSLEFLECIPNKKNCPDKCPYVLLIRVPYPPLGKRIAEIVNRWRKDIMVGELV